MKFTMKFSAMTLMLAGGLFSASAQATLTGIQCNTADVKVTTISQYSGTTATSTLNTIYASPAPAIASAACAGAFAGNDAFYPTTNLGYAGDGLLNGGVQNSTGQVLFPNPPGAFTTASYPLHDLDGDGQVNDPGWIMLGKFEPANGLWSFAPNAVGGDLSIVLGSFFSATITGAGKGTWALTPDATVAQRAEAILGKNYFDQFALVFKAGNEFAVYDFTAEQFGVTHPSADDPILNFSGTYDTSNTLRVGGNDKDQGKGKGKDSGTDGAKNPAGLSHISVWVRDPGATLEVPEPGVLALLGVALFGIGLARKHMAK